jgi:hypothetical protein
MGQFFRSFGVAAGLIGMTLAAAAGQTKTGAARGAIPRLQNGKPDMSGVWDKPRVMDMSKSNPGPGCGSGTLGCKQEGAGPLPFTAAGLAKYNRREEDINNFDPGVHCLPEGYVRSWGTTFPTEIVQNANKMAVMFENFGAFHVIPTDGRGHPKDLEPSWFGNSVGKWDGDTLVVDTIGFNDRTWIDTEEHPHSEALHVVERFDRLDPQHLGYEIEIDDPKTFTRPFKNKRVFALMKPGQELMEHVCEENNKELVEGHQK